MFSARGIFIIFLHFLSGGLNFSKVCVWLRGIFIEYSGDIFLREGFSRAFIFGGGRETLRRCFGDIRLFGGGGGILQIFYMLFRGKRNSDPLIFFTRTIKIALSQHVNEFVILCVLQDPSIQRRAPSSRSHPRSTGKDRGLRKKYRTCYHALRELCQVRSR